MLKQYVRDKRGNPIGIMLSNLNEKGELNTGYSVCHKRDNYNKKKGMMIATARLNNETMQEPPMRIEKEWNDFIDRSHRYWFKVAKKE
jgi:hypothetical protein